MQTLSALLAICAGNSPVTSEFPAQRPLARSFDVFFDLRRNEGWVNNREAGDLRCHRAHYDVTVIYPIKYINDFVLFLKVSSAWINSLRFRDTFIRRWTGSSLIWIMACRLVGTTPLPKPMLRYYQWDLRNNIQYDIQSRKCIWKCRMRYKILAFIFDFSVTRGKIFFRFISSNLENSTRAIACYVSCNNMTIETIVGTYYLIRKVKNMCTMTEGRPSRSCSHERGGGRWTIFWSVAAIEQTPFSSAFTCEKIIVFWPNCHLGMFPWVQMEKFNIGPGVSLVTKQTNTRLN